MKAKLKDIIFDYIMMGIGLAISAIGLKVFLVPGKIAAGGISGIATILYHIFGFKVGVTMLIINIPIFLLGLKVFGKVYGFKTFYGTVTLPIFIDLIGYIWPNAEFAIDYTKGGNMLLAPIFGGIIVGTGMGIVIKYGGNTGGTDILGQVLNKYTHIPVGYAIMVVDFAVILCATGVFGLEAGLYATIAVYSSGLFINKIMYGTSYSRLVYIISDEYEKIREIILEDLSRGGTGISANGLYTNKEKKMIMTVLQNKEIHTLTTFIKEVDKDAFVIVTDVYKVIGEGFTPIDKHY